jgi:hypothetical protein
MGYDYTKKLKVEGQQHSNACWAATISWWTSAMSLHYKRMTYTQTDLLADFSTLSFLGGSGAGGVPEESIKKIAGSAKVRMDIQSVSPTKLKTDYNFGTPCVIVFKYPAAGGTHMNVIFDQQDQTVMCMEPFYPLVALADGSRKGAYVRRPLSFFANSDKVLIGCLPLKDSANGTAE